MREDSFRNWLKSSGTMGSRPINDALSRCRRISESFNINLDSEFLLDGGQRVLSLLEYTAEDAKANKAAPPELHFNPGSNIKNGMASLKAAAKKYFEFCQSSTLWQ